MSEALLQVRGLSKRYGGIRACDGVDLDIAPAESHALIGPNGAGKTTLIAQLSGTVLPDAGRIRFAGRDITRTAPHRRARLGLARSFQITTVFADMTLAENVMLAVQARPSQGSSMRFWRPARQDPSLREPAQALLEQVGLGERAGRRADTVSHGEHRQLEIAMALATEPKLLLLDEPTAGMGADESARMVETLSVLKQRLPMLLVEHDMDAVFALADRLTVLVYGQVIASGEPAAIRADPAVRRAYLGDEQG